MMIKTKKKRKKINKHVLSLVLHKQFSRLPKDDNLNIKFLETFSRTLFVRYLETF